MNERDHLGRIIPKNSKKRGSPMTRLKTRTKLMGAKHKRTWTANFTWTTPKSVSWASELSHLTKLLKAEDKVAVWKSEIWLSPDQNELKQKVMEELEINKQTASEVNKRINEKMQ